MIIPIKIT